MWAANTPTRASTGPQLLFWKLTAFGAVPIVVFAYQSHEQTLPIFHAHTPVPSLLPWSRAAVSATADVPTPEAQKGVNYERALPDPVASFPEGGASEEVEQPLLANTSASLDIYLCLPMRMYIP
jgi:hypothetical protein